jgi:hypothetical protein
MGTCAASGAFSAASVNCMTGNPIGEGVTSSALIGLSAPLASGEATIAGGAGIGGVAGYSPNALSGVFFSVAATAAIGP